MHKQQGFTLLEVLLAITITAFIGVGSTQLLSSIIETKSATELRGTSYKYSQRADLWIKRDLSQIAGRETYDSQGAKRPEVNNQGDHLIEFTRSGLAARPLSKSKRSGLQHLAYDIQPSDSEDCQQSQPAAIEDKNNQDDERYCLVRLIWPELDNIQGHEPLKQVLLDDILDIKFQFRGGIIGTEYNLDWQESWPPYSPTGGTPDLVQIKMLLTLPMLGELYRVYEVPRYAFLK